MCLKKFSKRTKGVFGKCTLLILMLNVNVVRGHLAFKFQRDGSDLDKPIPMAQTAGVVGKKAALPCDIQPLATDDKVNMVLWFREQGGEPLYSYDVRGRLSSQPKLWSSPAGFSERAYFRAASSPAVLLIADVRASDAGIYRCRVDFKNSPTRNQRLNFTVIIPPSRPIITEAATGNQTHLLQPFNEGDTVHLVCEVSGGNPKPRVTWFLENSEIDASFEHKGERTLNELMFPHVGRQHFNARLVCQASNTNLAPPLTKLLILDLNLKPLSVEILNKSRELSADRSCDVTCVSAGSRPHAELTWWKGGRQLKKRVKNFSENNTTTSVFTFTPEAEDDGTTITCRAENPRLADSIEDHWTINVHYVPIVTLRLGSTLDPDQIKEGDDVYFECLVQANPPASRLSWYKGREELHGNTSTGVILSDHSLVLQSVTRSTAGDYSCAAHNPEGRGYSNPQTLPVQYAPTCKPQVMGEIHGASKNETVLLKCEVDSNPQPAGFVWTLNNSGDVTELDPSWHSTSGFTSTLRYKPTADYHFGTLACSAHNSAGSQREPCVFRLVTAGRPMPLQNCSLSNHSSTALQVQCEEAYDGGLPQTFLLEVLEMPSLVMRVNLSSSSPRFFVSGLDVARSYELRAFAANAKGRSEANTLYTVAARQTDKFTSDGVRLSLTPALAALAGAAALSLAVICGIVLLWYRRMVARRDQDKPNSFNELSIKQSTVDSLSKQDLDNTYMSAKLDNVDADPDVVTSSFERNLQDEYLYSHNQSSAENYEPRRNYNIPSSHSSSVNRGVTARSVDINRYRAEVVTTVNKVKESCI